MTSTSELKQNCIDAKTVTKCCSTTAWDLICTHSLEGVLLSLNPAAARTLGYEPDRGYGKSLSEFLAPSVRHSFPEDLRRIRVRGHDSGYMLVVANNRKKHVWLYRNLVVRQNGNLPYVVGHAMDVTEQKRVEYELQTTLKRLQSALSEVKTLRGLLPTCAWCKKIRTEEGIWSEMESYITKRSDASFSHGIRPDCRTRLRSTEDDCNPMRN